MTKIHDISKTTLFFIFYFFEKSNCFIILYLKFKKKLKTNKLHFKKSQTKIEHNSMTNIGVEM